MQVKYLYSSFKSANKKNLLSEYLFYLQLKSIGFEQGELFKGEVIKAIQEHFDYSSGAISIQIKKLINAGFITVYKHGSGKEWKYILNSYRSVWNKLGFRFTDQVERWKFEYIDLFMHRKKKSLKALIVHIETIRNKQKQRFKINELLNNKIKYHSETILKTKSKKVREKKEATLKRLKSIKLCSHQVTKLASKEPMTNRISCKKVAQILGYKTPMSALNILKKAEELNLLTINKAKSLVAQGISRIEFSVNPLYSGCYWMFGKVYKNECNIYVLSSIRKPMFDPISQTL